VKDSTIAAVLCLALLSNLGLASPGAAQSASDLEAALDGLSWRSIGPAEMGGRTTDIAAIPGDPSVVYMATASGGLFKTENGGISWRSILETGGTLSVGAIALAPSDENVLYVGSGEGAPRNSTSIGDGVYRSTDAGKSFTHVGLADIERVSRIRVHPRDPATVYVAALGHLWGPNEARGVYRSRDGGDTWDRVLYVDENTGAADLAIDPANPRILYAAMWDFRRRPWTFRSGGPGSGLYRSADGGDTWERLTDPALDNGLPSGTLGRIGIAIAASNPAVVYALIESKEEGRLWRSNDHGVHWAVVNRSRAIGSRPFYFQNIRVDPSDENTLYALAGGLSKSIDGGRTWRRIAGTIHGDHHAFWIDPEDPDRLIDGNDGGFQFSTDGGASWKFANTVPLAQFYHIAVDDRTPYTVCGGLQDNDVWCGPSRTLNVAGSIQNYWHEIVGPGDGMYVTFDPRNPDLAFTSTQGGSFFRVDLSTGEARSIDPYPEPTGGLSAGAHQFRFNWNAPIMLSPHDPDVLYAGGNVLFRSADSGQSWTAISPDLSNAEPEKLGGSGGPITPDNTTAEYHATIYTIAESPLEAGVLWVGTDDGNLQLTRDGGATWTELSGRIGGLPDGAWVSHVEASSHAPGAAFVSFDRHREDDMAPYVFATTDYGETWENISAGLPTPGYVHVVREDPRVAGLLYVGTETGVWFSPPPVAGASRIWASLRLGLPPVPVRDLLVHPRDNDLVIGTHGRGVWILDDVSPVQGIAEVLASGAPVHLFPARPATRYEPAIRRFRFDIGDEVFVGENPPYGALLTYYLAAGAADGDVADAEGGAGDEPTLKLQILAANGDTVRTLEVPGTAGLHRVAWNLRYGPFDSAEEGADAERGPGAGEGVRFRAQPPRVNPGTYTARLTAPGGESETAQAGSGGGGPPEAEMTIDVTLDARLSTSPADLEAQLAAIHRAGRIGAAVATLARELDSVREQLASWRDRLAGQSGGLAGRKRVEELESPPAGLADSAKALIDAADSIRVRIERPDGEDAARRLTYVPLSERLSGLIRQMGRATARPTDAQATSLDRYDAEWRQIESDYDAYQRRIEAFNRALSAAGLEAILPAPDPRK